MPSSHTLHFSYLPKSSILPLQLYNGFFSHSPFLFENTALEIQAIEKLTIQSGRQHARTLPYRDGLFYADVFDRGVGSSRPGRRVRFSPSLSSPAPVLRLQSLYFLMSICV